MCQNLCLAAKWTRFHADSLDSASAALIPVEKWKRSWSPAQTAALCLLEHLRIQSVCDSKSSSGPRRGVAHRYGHPSFNEGQESECPQWRRIPASAFPKPQTPPRPPELSEIPYARAFPWSQRLTAAGRSAEAFISAERVCGEADGT